MLEAPLSDQEIIEINYYLSKKWGLQRSMDSDQDGYFDNTEEGFGSSPIDATDIPIIDFSDTVDAQIGELSTIDDTIEESIELWIDAANIDFLSNATLSDGDSITRWYDLSGNGYSASQPLASLQPVYSSENISVIFDGVDDYLAIEDKYYQTLNLENISIFSLYLNQC